MVFHVEVSFSGFPFFAGFGQERANQTHQGSFIGKEARHAGAPFEFHIDSFQRVTGAQPALMGYRKVEDGQALREVFFHPSGQLGRGGSVSGDDLLEPRMGAEPVRAASAPSGRGNTSWRW